jgi:outer membrane protein
MEINKMHEAKAVGTVYDRTFFEQSGQTARSQTAPAMALRVILFVSALFFANQLFGQAPVRLTLDEAKTMALANHPQVLAAQNEASYSAQEVTLARAPYFPTISADLTGTQSNDPTARIGAVTLPASRLFDRFGQGIVFSQVVTDSGRTKNLVASSRLQSEASTQTYQATRYDVLLEVNRAYYATLHAQAVVRVAQATVSARQLLLDQVTTLANNNLRSQLDVSFADVNVSEAKLLLLRAQDAVQSSLADLTRAMGTDQQANYQLVDEPLPQGPPDKADMLVMEAISNRPEIAGFRAAKDAADKFAQAEKDLKRPTLSLVGAAGFLPYINSPGIPNGYEGVGLNLDFPIFNGHAFSAREAAARYKADEADQRLRDVQERIARDVRVAWASTVNAFQRIDVTAQFLRQAALAQDLAQGRYNLGLASIVELTQAQLNVTQAEIENLSAKYEFQAQNAALQYSAGLLR